MWSVARAFCLGVVLFGAWGCQSQPKPQVEREPLIRRPSASSQPGEDGAASVASQQEVSECQALPQEERWACCSAHQFEVSGCGLCHPAEPPHPEQDCLRCPLGPPHIAMECCVGVLRVYYPSISEREAMMACAQR